MKVRNLDEAKKYLYQFIPETQKRFPGEFGFLRAKKLLDLLRNPQDRLKIIHIAGTSGKGSTAYLTSIMLKSLGFKVGLHISPHLKDIRERLQINNKLISVDLFCRYLNHIIPAIEKMLQTRYGKPSYFEILVALTFYIFVREKVDFSVIETGLGGLFDATNTISNPNKISIITRIGFDHMHILGNTLPEITYQKAMIIPDKGEAVTLRQEQAIRKVIEKVARQKAAKLYYLEEKTNYKIIKADQNKTIFDFSFLVKTYKALQLNLIGLHQVENCSLALVALILLNKKYRFSINQFSLRKALKKASFQGRMEIIKIQKRDVIFDGAHNPQKIFALTKSLRKLFPRKKFRFLVSFLKSKDYAKMLLCIIPLANEIIITRFYLDNQDIVHVSEDPGRILQAITKLGFHKCHIVDDTNEALKFALSKDKEPVVITGSLYLISSLYSYM